MNMKNRNFLFTFFAALIAFTMVAGCAPSAHQKSTGEYVDDAVITTKVKAAIVEDKQLSALEIGVETFKGRVQLSGFVKSSADVSHATEVARKVKGVQSVQNNLIVK